MRKLIESTLVSLDGVTEAPERWATFGAENTALSLERLGNYDAFVLDRVTDETFFATWGHTAVTPTPTASLPLPSALHPGHWPQTA
jgi:hypothetical protein